MMILAQSLTIDTVLVNNCIQFTTWGFSSLLLAEIVRDAYHALCHQITWLAKWHNKHHAVYKRDLSLIYQKSYLDS